VIAFRQTVIDKASSKARQLQELMVVGSDARPNSCRQWGHSMTRSAKSRGADISIEQEGHVTTTELASDVPQANSP
jgi:hypothetical protein